MAAVSTMTTATTPTDSWRLPAQHVQDLRDVARGVEETNAGVCTRYLLDELERNGPPGEDEVALFDAERFVDRFDASALDKLLGAKLGVWRSKMKRCRRALAMLQERGNHRSVAVLHVAYGYPDPMTRAWSKNVLDFLGPELTPLVRYTDAVEVVRRQLVRDGIAHQRSLATSWVTQYALRRVKKPEEKQQHEDVVDFASYRAAERYLDRCISSGDALRSVFDPFPEPKPKRIEGETKEEHEKRCEPWEDRKATHAARCTTLLVEARVEADRMLTLASRAYHEAWRVVRL